MRGPTVPAAVAAAMVVMLVAAVPASASAPQSAPIASVRLAPASPAAGRLAVDLKVKRFIQRGGQTQASGVVTATLSGAGAAPTTVRQRVLLQARPGASCQILLLTLDQL